MNNLKLVNNFNHKIVNHIHNKEQYKNNFSVLTNSNSSKIKAVGYVRYSDINTFGNHQTRVDDLDPQHVSNLKDQIQTNGLSKIPYVEWNEEEESFVPLSGHHRIQAFHNINVDSYGKDDDTSLIPVCVVEFYDDIEREVFLQRENTNHEAQKIHTQNDAIRFLQKLKSLNYDSWNDLIKAGEFDKVRDSAYKAMKRAGYPYQTTNKMKIFNKAFEGDLKMDTLRTITTKESTSKSTHLWQVPKTDQWINNIYVIAGDDNASTKSLKIASRKKLKYVKKNNLYGCVPLGKIKMHIHFSAVKSFGALQNRRLNFLDTIVDENRFDYCNQNYNMVVDEIVFPPQFKSGDGKIKETMDMRFIWDYQKRTFVLSKDRSKIYSQIFASKSKKIKDIKKKASKPSKTIQYKSDKYYEKQLQVYNMIADKVGFTPRNFPTKTVFFNAPEAKAIALKINPDFDFTNKTVCGNKRSIFKNVVIGWKHQATTATHPNLENMERIYNSL